jgi:hypothetical protein
MKTLAYLLAAFALTYALTSCSLTTKDGTVFSITPEAVRVVEIIAEK